MLQTFHSQRKKKLLKKMNHGLSPQVRIRLLKQIFSLVAYLNVYNKGKKKLWSLAVPPLLPLQGIFDTGGVMQPKPGGHKPGMD